MMRCASSFASEGSCRSVLRIESNAARNRRRIQLTGFGSHLGKRLRSGPKIAHITSTKPQDDKGVGLLLQTEASGQHPRARNDTHTRSQRTLMQYTTDHFNWHHSGRRQQHPRQEQEAPPPSGPGMAAGARENSRTIKTTLRLAITPRCRDCSAPKGGPQLVSG